MKKFIFMGVIGLFLLGSCNSKSGEGHNHETEEHAHAGHDHEGHDHANAPAISMTTDMTTVRKPPPRTVTKSYCRRPKRRLPE